MRNFLITEEISSASFSVHSVINIPPRCGGSFSNDGLIIVLSVIVPTDHQEFAPENFYFPDTVTTEDQVKVKTNYSINVFSGVV